MSNKKEYRASFTYDGRRYYVRGRNQRELLENLEKRKKEAEDGRENYINPKLDSYYDSFTDIRRNEIRESTIRAQKYEYRNIADVPMYNGKKFGQMRIRDIKRRDIEYARQYLLQHGKSPQNLNTCFAHLNHVFHQAVIDELIEKNPCKALKQLKRKTKPARETIHRALTEEETRKFFAEAVKENAFFLNAYQLMIRTGMRIGEIGALIPEDIDERNGFIHIRRTIVRNEIGGYEIGDDTKTDSGNRDIPLTDEVLDCIRNQIERNQILYTGNSDENYDYDDEFEDSDDDYEDSYEEDGEDPYSERIFRSYEGGIVREYFCNREIKRICKNAGIEKFTCHAFRATFATRFIEQRPQDYKILSEILGHSNTAITLDLYTHVMTENKINAMNNIKIAT